LGTRDLAGPSFAIGNAARFYRRSAGGQFCANQGTTTMRGFSLAHITLATMAIATWFGSSAAQAQNNQTFVSSAGVGNTCTRSAPCGLFSQAYAVTNPGGEIFCVDSGSFGSLNILQSLTVNCTGTKETINGSIITITTAATDVVVLKGLVVDLNGATSTGIPSGIISFSGSGVLHVEQVSLNNSKGDRLNGIYFAPNGPSKLIVADSSITNIGTAGTTAGIYIKPVSNSTANVSIERSRIENNFFGIVADGTGNGRIRGLVSDSFITNNVNNGITVATASGLNVVLTVDNTKVSGNNFGLVANGSNSGMLVRRSILNNNGTGLFSSNGGVLISYKDNSLNGNFTADGAFTASINTQ
jgi:hypothetical protein